MWNQLSSHSSANSNRNGHENGHRIVTFRARFVFLWHFGHRIAAFRARFGFGPFMWYIFGQVCKIMLDLAGRGQGGGRELHFYKQLSYFADTSSSWKYGRKIQSHYPLREH